MNNLKTIRGRLGLTQQALADAIGCTQSNVGHYEKGQTLMPETARKVIEIAAGRGLEIGFDHVYGVAPLPDQPLTQSTQELAQPSTPAQEVGNE